jgi:hypothetical protein
MTKQNQKLNLWSAVWLLVIAAYLGWQTLSPVWQTNTPNPLPTVAATPPKTAKTVTLTPLTPNHICPNLSAVTFDPIRQIWRLEFPDVPAKWVTLRYQNAPLESAQPFKPALEFPTENSIGTWTVRVDNCTPIILNR